MSTNHELLPPRCGLAELFLARPSARQVLNLSVSVAGTLGGVMLLASNLAVPLVARVGTVPWLPVGANVALLFGGLMFAREYRRGR